MSCMFLKRRILLAVRMNLGFILLVTRFTSLVTGPRLQQLPWLRLPVMQKPNPPLKTEQLATRVTVVPLSRVTNSKRNTPPTATTKPPSSQRRQSAETEPVAQKPTPIFVPIPMLQHLVRTAWLPAFRQQCSGRPSRPPVLVQKAAPNPPLKAQSVPMLTQPIPLQQWLQKASLFTLLTKLEVKPQSRCRPRLFPLKHREVPVARLGEFGTSKLPLPLWFLKPKLLIWERAQAHALQKFIYPRVGVTKSKLCRQDSLIFIRPVPFVPPGRAKWAQAPFRHLQPASIRLMTKLLTPPQKTLVSTRLTSWKQQLVSKLKPQEMAGPSLGPLTATLPLECPTPISGMRVEHPGCDKARANELCIPKLLPIPYPMSSDGRKPTQSPCRWLAPSARLLLVLQACFAQVRPAPLT